MSVKDQNYIYFFPKTSRQEAEGVLGFRTLGTFLYRGSSSTPGGIVLSIKQRRSVLHILLRYSQSTASYVFLSKGSVKSSMEKKCYTSLADITADLKMRRLVGSGVVNPDHVPSNIPPQLASAVAEEKISAAPALGEQGKSALQEMLGVKRNLKDYRMMIRVFAMDKCITPEEIRQLGRFRKDHGISQDRHIEILAGLGISNQDWEHYVEVGKSSKSEEKEKESKISSSAHDWNEKQVVEWLTLVSKKYHIQQKTIDKFKGEDVNGEALLELDRPMMMQLGITMGQSNAVFKAIEQLKG